MVAAVLAHLGKNRLGTADRGDHRHNHPQKTITMNCWRTKAIIAGTSFGMLFTAIKDEIDIPDVLPEIIPSAWFDNLDRYRITAQLSTSRRGVCIVARSDTSADLKIERRDSAHYFINVPASATVDMDEGEIVLTIELRDHADRCSTQGRASDNPLIKAREIRP